MTSNTKWIQTDNSKEPLVLATQTCRCFCFSKLLCKVQGENLAMQALQIDISNLVPGRAANKSSAIASESLGLGSWSLAGRKKQKDQGQGLAGACWILMDFQSKFS